MERDANSEEQVRCVLRSWLALEVLTPQVTKDGWNGFAAEKQGQQRNRKSDASDGPAHWEAPGDTDPTPWPPMPEPPEDEGEQGRAGALILQSATSLDRRRPWYVVVLGAQPAKQAFEALDAVFSDAADEDQTYRRTQGHVIAATVVLDEWGVLVPDTLAIASFSWGLGHLMGGGSTTALADWDTQELVLKDKFANLLTPTGPNGRPRSLSWRDLRAVSHELATDMGVARDLWIVTPCAILANGKSPPEADILSSFLLPDLLRVGQEAGDLPTAVATYLGQRPPTDVWDALSDRPRLASLLDPNLFPLSRWPGPGLHPLTLLQQAAVNAITRDLAQEGIAAVNGPPGTGKTTLLRDLVAHVMVSRSERLAEIDDPRKGIPDLDLMDFAIVVGSTNNAAVENISLELPVRAKALDESAWQKDGLDYFGHTANFVLGTPADAPQEERAWGLMAARLGNAGNRRAFASNFWSNPDWGLDNWLNWAGWPDVQRKRSKPPGQLVLLDPPPRAPEAMAAWRSARDAFRSALDHSRQLRTGLEALSGAARRLRDVETQRPAAEERLVIADRDLASAKRAVATASSEYNIERQQLTREEANLAARSSVAPSPVAKLFYTRSWQEHAVEMRNQLSRLNRVQDLSRAALERFKVAEAEETRCAGEQHSARSARDHLVEDTKRLALLLEHGQGEVGGTMPGPGFWLLPDDDLQRQAPWNGGAFRAARDALFAAAIRLHRAFIVAGVRTLKPSLNIIAKALAGVPDAPKPTPADWGVFFLMVPVASTTFASFGRMFQTLKAQDIGWLLIDEAGQAPPQAAVGAIWRARRAVVIGDPLQIEPIATMPRRTTQFIFENNGADVSAWAAPDQSAQTLADRVSRIQGRFWLENAKARHDERITGIPLLVHRRCERPMFDIANSIAYADRMVFATSQGASPIRNLLGPSAWIDVDAPSSDKWVEAEGQLIVTAIARASEALGAPPDLYVICPFKMPAARLRGLLARTPAALPGLTATARAEWIKKRVGTVHTFQGKEAEAVILMLGAGRGARAGARSWAGGTPNLLNVAATRAKKALYIIGNHAEWEGVGVFATAALELKVRPAHEWLSVAKLEAPVA